jgi:hypothetical protein
MIFRESFHSPKNWHGLAWKALLALFFALIIAINWYFLRSGTKYLLDFGSFMASGIAAAKGQNPYSSDSPLILVVFFKWIGMSIPAPNLNPPITVLLFESISNFEPSQALQLWRITSAVGYIFSILLLARAYRNSFSLFRVAWAFCLAGFWHTIHLGQIYIPLLIAVIAAWILSEKRYLKTAGIALGILIATKPNFVYWAFILGIGGYWSVLLAAGLTALSISIVPLMVYGPTIYLQWIATLQGSPEAGLLMPGNSSLHSLSFHLFGYSFPGMILSIILAILGIYLAFRNRSDIRKINSAGIIISLLISPIAWTGYTIFTLPIFAAKDEWSITDQISAILFVIPIWIVLAIASLSMSAFHIFGWTYGWGLLLLLPGIFMGAKTATIARSEFQS